MFKKKIEKIFCAAGNKRFAAIALKYGFTYGAQLPNTVYYPVEFADQNFKDPNRVAYMQALKEHKPRLATVIDYEDHVTHDEVISWATEAALYSQEIIIVPKIKGTIPMIPDRIANRPIRLGYSVETSHGNTIVDLEEFGKRPVHLLGGSPQKQIELACHLKYKHGQRGVFNRVFSNLNVVSVDTNYHQRQAVLYNQFFASGAAATNCKNKWFPMLQESVFGHVMIDAPYLAFELSCMNIQAAWTGCPALIRFAVKDDIQAIKGIANQAKNQVGFVMIPALKESIDRKGLIIAEMNSKVVGFLNYRVRRDAITKIYELAVDRAYRHMGIGRGMIAATPGNIELKCTKDNPANQFYEALGFDCYGSESGRQRQLNLWRLYAAQSTDHS